MSVGVRKMSEHYHIYGTGYVRKASDDVSVFWGEPSANLVLHCIGCEQFKLGEQCYKCEKYEEWRKNEERNHNNCSKGNDSRI